MTITAPTTPQPCPLCNTVGEKVLWKNNRLRIILVDDADYPAFCRVIWQQHCAEMSDLAVQDRQYLMHVVFTVESLLREGLNPDKINLASLGNLVPHLHWHIIPRFRDDRHFPNPVWGEFTQHQSWRRATIDEAWLINRLKQKLD